MNRAALLAVSAFVVLAGVTAASAADFVITPLNISTSCLGFSRIEVRDHRVSPPRVTARYTASVQGCDAAGGNSRLALRYLGGSDYNGGAGALAIRSIALNRCLTNPALYRGGRDPDEWRWEPCAGQGPDAARQTFYIQRNQSGAVRLESHLQFVLGVPNAVIECVEQKTPQVVYRTPCRGLNNWAVRALR